MSAQGSTSFHITVSESTIYVQCPPGTSPGILCALGGGPAQSVVLGPLTEDFTAKVDAHPDHNGDYPIQSLVTLTNTNGDELRLDGLGVYNPGTGSDTESFQTVSGTGAFAAASGSGTVHTITTEQNGPTTYSTSTYDGTLNGYRPFRLYLPLIAK